MREIPSPITCPSRAQRRPDNQGHTGNMPLATLSPAQLVQVLAPNGLEKFELGQTVAAIGGPAAWPRNTRWP